MITTMMNDDAHGRSVVIMVVKWEAPGKHPCLRLRHKSWFCLSWNGLGWFFCMQWILFCLLSDMSTCPKGSREASLRRYYHEERSQTPGNKNKMTNLRQVVSMRWTFLSLSGTLLPLLLRWPQPDTVHFLPWGSKESLKSSHWYICYMTEYYSSQ